MDEVVHRRRQLMSRCRRVDRCDEDDRVIHEGGSCWRKSGLPEYVLCFCSLLVLRFRKAEV